jgi:hypothetical protein
MKINGLDSMSYGDLCEVAHELGTIPRFCHVARCINAAKEIHGTTVRQFKKDARLPQAEVTLSEWVRGYEVWRKLTAKQKTVATVSSLVELRRMEQFDWNSVRASFDALHAKALLSVRAHACVSSFVSFRNDIALGLKLDDVTEERLFKAMRQVSGMLRGTMQRKEVAKGINRRLRRKRVA